MTCLGAPSQWLTHEPRKVGYAAHLGTLAHALGEAAIGTLKGEVRWKPGMKFDVDGVEVEVDDAMIDGVKLFVNTVSLISEFSLWRMLESEVSLAWLWEGSEPPESVFGFLDMALCDGVCLYVVDFKYGSGKAIKAERNTQLLMYALGALGKLKSERPDLYATLESVCLVIVQPRAGGDPVRQWALSVSDLLYWGFSTLKPAVERIADNDPPPPLTPGNHCFWCAASVDCPAYAKYKNDRHAASYPDYDPSKEDLEFEEAV